MVSSSPVQGACLVASLVSQRVSAFVGIHQAAYLTLLTSADDLSDASSPPSVNLPHLQSSAVYYTGLGCDTNTCVVCSLLDALLPPVDPFLFLNKVLRRGLTSRLLHNMCLAIVTFIHETQRLPSKRMRGSCTQGHY